MERLKYPERLSRQQESFGQRRIKRWLGRLARRAKSDSGDGGGTMSSHTGSPGENPGEPEGAEPSGAPAESKTEEFLALLPEGSELPEGFADEAAKLGLDPTGSKRVRYPYPAIVLGAGASFNPASLGTDWRLSASPDSKAYKEAIENPKNESDESFREGLKTIIDMGLFPYID
jgi:hypothetical protein